MIDILLAVTMRIPSQDNEPVPRHRRQIQCGKRLRVEISVGQELKDECRLGRREPLRLEVRGTPKWDGKQGRLELAYDEGSDTLGLSNQSPYLIFDWDQKKSPSTLARTTSPRTQRPLVPSFSTTGGSCSDGSVRRPTKSPGATEMYRSGSRIRSETIRVSVIIVSSLTSKNIRTLHPGLSGVSGCSVLSDSRPWAQSTEMIEQRLCKWTALLEVNLVSSSELKFFRSRMDKFAVE